MNIDLLTIIGVTLFSSFGHCYSMCGGFNLAFLHLNSGAKRLFLLILIYHSFRIIAYIFLGTIFSLFGNIFAFSSLGKGILFFFLGIFMIVLGFALIFRGKLLKILENEIIFKIIIKDCMKRYFRFRGLKSAVVLGFLNGFVPCGLVYFFLAFAMSKANLSEGVFIMVIFGISTLPAMFIFALLGEILNKKFKKAFTFFSYSIIILYGIYLTYLGLSLTR